MFNHHIKMNKYKPPTFTALVWNPLKNPNVARNPNHHSPANPFSWTTFDDQNKGLMFKIKV